MDELTAGQIFSLCMCGLIVGGLLLWSVVNALTEVLVAKARANIPPPPGPDVDARRRAEIVAAHAPDPYDHAKDGL